MPFASSSQNITCIKYYKGWPDGEKYLIFDVFCFIKSKYYNVISITRAQSGATKTIYLSMSFASSKYCKGTGLVGGNHFKDFSQV